MFRSFITAAVFGILSIGFVPASHAQEGFIDDQGNAPAAGQAFTGGQTFTGGQANAGDDRLMIVNGNSGHVVYDDGRPDLFCVTRVVVRGHTWSGYPIYRRTMRCR